MKEFSYIMLDSNMPPELEWGQFCNKILFSFHVYRPILSVTAVSARHVRRAEPPRLLLLPQLID